MGTVEKRQQKANLSDLTEPQMSAQDWDDFRRGVVLFNEGKFWESHEAWEEVWKRHSENSRLFFQGLIQVAAGLHQLERNIVHGAEKHLRNALWKLKPFQPVFLGINVKKVVDVVESGRRELLRSEKSRLKRIQDALTSQLKL
jgi:hypothetical protein